MYGLCFAALLTLSSALPTNPTTQFEKKQATNCPLYLSANNIDFPHLIVPISASAPNAVLGNTYTPSISPNDLATIFNFDIPTSRAGQNCSLYFSLPTQAQLVTSSFTFWGPGTFDIAQYRNNTGASPSTTWNSQPHLSSIPPSRFSQVSPGHSYKVWSGSCGQGGLLSWRMSSPDSCLWLFQDYNDCAIGAYVLYG